MKRSLLPVALGTLCGTLFVLVIAWPSLALAIRVIEQGKPPTDGFTFSPRQLALLWESIRLSAISAGLCVVVSLPGAFVVGRARGLSQHPVIGVLLVSAILFPPTSYVFGWQQVLPATFPSDYCCIGVWTMWAWPIPALILGAGWSRVGRGAYEAAVLSTSSARAFLSVVVPLLSRYATLALLILFLIFLADYGVPHACGLRVFSIELLGWAENSNLAIDTLWASLPGVVVTLAALATLVLVWLRCTPDRDADTAAARAGTPSRSLYLITLGCITVSLLVPVGLLIKSLSSVHALGAAIATYQVDFVWSLLIAGVSGAAAVVMAMGAIALVRVRTTALIWALVFGSLPGSLIGEAVLTAYLGVGFIYSHWPILVIGCCARYAWVAFVVVWLTLRDGEADLTRQAQSDGAGEIGVAVHVHWPSAWPALLCGAGIVAALSLGDVATTSMTRTPTVHFLPHIIIEKIHRFEGDMVASLTLLTVAASIPAAIAVLVALKRRTVG